MSISVECPHCGRSYTVKDELAGKSLRCRNCQSAMRVPSSDDNDDEYDDEAPDDDAGDQDDADPPPRSRPVAKTKRRSSGGSPWLWVLGIVGGMLVTGLLCCGGVVFVAFRQIAGSVPVPPGKTFDEWRSGFQTKLIQTGPAPQGYDPETLPENVTEVKYPSGTLQLKAWVFRPPEVVEPRPALVFFHGGFAFSAGDLESCQPFMDAGFVVMAPMLRGENGNPGNYELFFGEVDDARAACQWIAKEPYVQSDRVYTFGHSVGGGVSAVLSLLKDVPIRHGGSSGGLYDHWTFTAWQVEGDVPFQNNPHERSVRLLLGNTAHMEHKHYAFVGDDDNYQETAEAVQNDKGNAHGKLVLERMPGDHFESFDPAIKKYLQIVQQDGK